MTKILAWLKTRTGKAVVPIPDKSVVPDSATQSQTVPTSHNDAQSKQPAAAYSPGYSAPKRPGEHTVTHRIIPEHKVEGKPLGRHIRHDSRSLNFLVEPDGTTATVRWTRELGVLNQGNTGSCTGQAATGALGTAPDYAALSSSQQSALGEPFALNLYSAAEKIDGGAGLPTEDNGSSGLSVAKAAKAQGLISGYLHITSLAAAKTAIQTGTFLVGSNWYTGMDTPDPQGLVVATGTVRGGHEYECLGYTEATDTWEFENSWGPTFGVGGRFFYTSATFTKLLGEQGDATVLQPLGAAPFPPTPVPVPVATSVVVDDPSLVAKIDQLATKDKMDPRVYLAQRLHALWPSAK